MHWLDFAWMASPAAWVALLTLSVMEIVLGIDNIVFISILTAKLPAAAQPRARQLGLALALVTRLALLAGVKALISLEREWWVIGEPDAAVAHETGAFRFGVSGKGLILLGGGLFLLYKATKEIWEKLEGPRHDRAVTGGATFGWILVQIALFDLIFSLDSVLTAVGMADALMVMALAMILAMVVMLCFVNPISEFIGRHPSLEILALSFLLLIGVMLVAEGSGQHMPKGYIYSAMVFSVLVEMLNMRFRAKRAPVQLHDEPAVDG